MKVNMNLCTKSKGVTLDLRDFQMEQGSFWSQLKKIKSLSYEQLEKLLLVGNNNEKVLAQAQLDLIEFQRNIKKQIAVMVEETANEAFEEALNKAGYKLIGHIEKM